MTGNRIASKTIAILQPGYLPWLGYFEQMALADLFVYFDNVQFTRKDWRSRNRIVMDGREFLLSVPARKAPLGTPIRDIEISYDQPWYEKHLKQISAAYKNTPHFQPLFSELEQVFADKPAFLWELDVRLAETMARFLGIKTKTAFASDVPDQSPDKNQRIIDICKYFEADALYDGKASEEFIDTALFRDNGIEVVFQDYQHPVYKQAGNPEFISHMSSIDLLFNAGDRAKEILLSSPSTLESQAA